ncbi:MAG: methylmalonyl Co-A mutase-associated GTPase MeaB [Thermoprotei archaeon]
MPSATGLSEEFRAGSIRALSRAITIAENSPEDAAELISQLSSRGQQKQAHIIGVSGAPGIGKSTLIEKMAADYSSKGLRVGVLAIDPTSPYTEGAVLGDRSRMSSLTLNSNVYIRSMGTRGHLGGLSRAAWDAMRILRAFGEDVIIVETTGTGQNEVEVAGAVHTNVVVMMPGLGDGVQLIESGGPEIGDIFVLNKADSPGADAAVAEIRAMVQLRYGGSRWAPPVVTTVATTGLGVGELVRYCQLHLEYLGSTGELPKKEETIYRNEVVSLVQEKLSEIAKQIVKQDSRAAKLLDDGSQSRSNPHVVAERIVELILKSGF